MINEMKDRDIEEVLKKAREIKNSEKEDAIISLVKKAISNTLTYYGKGSPTQPNLDLGREEHRNIIISSTVEVFKNMFAVDRKNTIIVINNPQYLKDELEKELGRVCREFYSGGSQRSNLLSPVLKKELAERVIDVFKNNNCSTV